MVGDVVELDEIDDDDEEDEDDVEDEDEAFKVDTSVEEVEDPLFVLVLDEGEADVSDTELDDADEASPPLPVSVVSC